jgi:hypothetical protein
VATPQPLPGEYFETRFRTPLPPDAWPARFAIITAWATTGEHWSPARNQDADARLAAHLAACRLWHHRLTGYSPRTGHAEAGWAVELAPDAARAVGMAFQQHAIYTVQDDALAVLRCEDGRVESVGRFSERVDR